MVNVKFFNLLRSKYKIQKVEVIEGTIFEIIKQIQVLYPEIEMDDFKYCVGFINSKRIISHTMFSEEVRDGDELVFTHFIGGG